MFCISISNYSIKFGNKTSLIIACVAGALFFRGFGVGGVGEEKTRRRKKSARKKREEKKREEKIREGKNKAAFFLAAFFPRRVFFLAATFLSFSGFFP